MNAPKAKTLAEIMAELASNPDWVKREAEREAAHRAAAEARMVEMKPEMDPLLAELRGSGYDFESLADFVNTDQSYPDAIPILLRHLASARHPVLRNMIARALTVREARGLAGPVIIRELSKQKDHGQAQWALANALTVVATLDDLPAIEALLATATDEDLRERLERAVKSAEKRR